MSYAAYQTIPEGFSREKGGFDPRVPGYAPMGKSPFDGPVFPPITDIENFQVPPAVTGSAQKAEKIIVDNTPTTFAVWISYIAPFVVIIVSTLWVYGDVHPKETLDIIRGTGIHNIIMVVIIVLAVPLSEMLRKFM